MDKVTWKDERYGRSGWVGSKKAFTERYSCETGNYTLQFLWGEDKEGFNIFMAQKRGLILMAAEQFINGWLREACLVYVSKTIHLPKQEEVSMSMGINWVLDPEKVYWVYFDEKSKDSRLTDDFKAVVNKTVLGMFRVQDGEFYAVTAQAGQPKGAQ